MSKIVCRGSLFLGSGCGRCERCEEEREKLAQAAAASREDAFQAPSPAPKMPSPEAHSPWNKPHLTNWGQRAQTVDTSASSWKQEVRSEPEAASGLPVAGYKATQPAWALALVNINRVLEEHVLRQIEEHQRGPHAELISQRDVAIAKTGIEDAFMRLNRGVFQPQRLQGELPPIEARK